MLYGPAPGLKFPAHRFAGPTIRQLGRYLAAVCPISSACTYNACCSWLGARTAGMRSTKLLCFAVFAHVSPA